jgi:hypothetical protein
MAFILLQASHLHGLVFLASVHSDALLSIEVRSPGPWDIVASRPSSVLRPQPFSPPRFREAL